MAHNHPGPASTTAYFAGCRDGRCVKQHDNWQKLRKVARATAPKPVVVQPVAVQVTTPAQVTTPEPSRAIRAAAAVHVSEQLVMPEPPVMEDADLGRHVLDSIRVLRLTAGAV